MSINKKIQAAILNHEFRNGKRVSLPNGETGVIEYVDFDGRNIVYAYFPEDPSYLPNNEEGYGLIHGVDSFNVLK